MVDDRGRSSGPEGEAPVGQGTFQRESSTNATKCKDGQASAVQTDSRGRIHAEARSDDQLHNSGITRKRKQRGWVETRTVKIKGKPVVKWIGFWKDGSKRKEETIGLKAQYLKGEAQDKLADEIIPAYFARQSGDVVSTSKPKAKRVPTLAEAAQTYLSLREETWTKRTQGTLRSVIMNHIVAKLGKYEDEFGINRDYLVTDILPSQVQAFFNRVVKEGGSYNKEKRRASESLIKKVVTHTRAIFDVCIDDDILLKNPARTQTVRKPKGLKPNHAFLDVNQIQALIVAAAKRSYRDYIIVRVELVCGLRPSELFALRVDDVLQGRLQIDETVVLGEIKEDGKTTESTVPVPLPARLHQELLNFIQQEGIQDTPREFLFPSEIGTVMITDNYLDRVLKPLGLAANVPNLTFQMLRRTTATHFQNYGEVKDTQALLRHTDVATTLGVYQQTITRNLAAAATKWDDSLCLLGGTIQ